MILRNNRKEKRERERGGNLDMKTEITFLTSSLNYSGFKTEEVKLRGFAWFRYIHSCFNQLLNLFWQADELSGKSMASYKIIHCIGIPKHKGTTGQFICQFNAFPPFSLLIPCTEQMMGLSTLVIVLNPIKFMFPSDFPVTD